MYEVTIMMRKMETHNTFVPAFLHFCAELIKLQDSLQGEPLDTQIMAGCYITRTWVAGNVPAFFDALEEFALTHGLIKDGEPVFSNPPEVDEGVVEKFYIILRERAVRATSRNATRVAGNVAATAS